MTPTLFFEPFLPSITTLNHLIIRYIGSECDLQSKVPDSRGIALRALLSDETIHREGIALEDESLV
jgi:hypothetical protein